MKFFHARTEMYVRRTVNIIDGPEIPYPDSSVVGRKVLLTKVQLFYAPVGGLWRIVTHNDGQRKIAAEGWVLNKAGARSQRRWAGELPTGSTRAVDSWLEKLIEGARPTGTPNFPFDTTEA